MTDYIAPKDEHEATQDFNHLEQFLTNEIARLEASKINANFMEKRRITKKMKPLQSLLKKCEKVRGK
jgi:hypothetical protein